MECAVDNCKDEHDLFIKSSPDDNHLFAVCESHSEPDKDALLDFKSSRAAKEVNNYQLSYNPDDHLTEKLSQAWHIIEKAIKRYDGDQKIPLRIAINGQQKLGQAIDDLEDNNPG